MTRRGPWIPAAIRVLEQLRADYPHALKVRAELVLAYLEVGDRDRADKELASLEKTFPVEQDEETLCRFGRLHREVGDDWANATPSTDEHFRMAARAYERAWTHYDRAFNRRFGHYPGINRASLFFLRGWATRAPDLRHTLLAQAREAARELLNRREEMAA